MRYDVLLLKNGGQEHIVLERDGLFVGGDALPHDSDVYSVIRLEEGHGDFDALVVAEWRGKVGIGQFTPP
jgi:hypothetical protein